MKRGSRILDFSYDASGNLVGFSYRSGTKATPTYYYYALNSRGDVIGLYNASGSLTYLKIMTLNGDCYYCKAEKKADVLVISNSSICLVLKHFIQVT